MWPFANRSMLVSLKGNSLRADLCAAYRTGTGTGSSMP
jgi:hypothetical protein